MPGMCVCRGGGRDKKIVSLSALLSAHLRCDLRSEPGSPEKEDCFDILSEENLKKPKWISRTGLSQNIYLCEILNKVISIVTFTIIICFFVKE